MTPEYGYLPAVITQEEIDQLFDQLPYQTIAQFHQAHQLWLHKQEIAQLQIRREQIEQQIEHNATLMARIQPSPVALATLAQLQSCGVYDAQLLDRMLERGDAWLDHAMELLQRCEKLDLIGGDYTQWCEHALEGAYDWMDSIKEATADELAGIEIEPIILEEEIEESLTLPEATEDELLQKLMSDDTEESGSLPVVTEEELLKKFMSDEDEEQFSDPIFHAIPQASRGSSTRPLAPLEEAPESATISTEVPTTLVLATPDQADLKPVEDEAQQATNYAQPPADEEKSQPEPLAEEIVEISPTPTLVVEDATIENGEAPLLAEHTPDQERVHSNEDASDEPGEQPGPTQSSEDVGNEPREQPEPAHSSENVGNEPIEQPEPAQSITHSEEARDEHELGAEDTSIGGETTSDEQEEHLILQVEAEDFLQVANQWPFIYEEIAEKHEEEKEVEREEEQSTESETDSKEAEETEEGIAALATEGDVDREKEDEAVEKPHAEDEDETKQRGFLRRSLSKFLGR